MLFCPICGTRNKIENTNCRRCLWDFNSKSYKSDYCSRCNQPLLYPNKSCPFCSKISPKIEKICSNCKKMFKVPLWQSLELTSLEKALLKLSDEDVTCEDCTPKLQGKAKLKNIYFKKKFKDILNDMPVLTLEEPINLTIIKYCHIITAQNTIEKDLLQKLSLKQYYENPDFSIKIQSKEDECLKELKKTALKSGANAILGIKYIYSEVKNKNNPFLVTAMGTGVIVEEFNILSEQEQKVFNELINNI